MSENTQATPDAADVVEEEVFNPMKVDQANPDRLPYPLRYSHEAHEAPADIEVSEYDRSPEGYLDLEWQYKDTERALGLDYERFMQSRRSRKELVEEFKPRLEQINAKRRELRDSNPDADIKELDPDDPERPLSERFFWHVLRPKWRDHLPRDDSPEQQAAWESFKADYPESMQINLEELRLLDGKLRVLSNDEELQQQIREAHADHLVVMRAASAWQGTDRRLETLSRRMAEIYKNAAISNRGLTGAEKRFLERLSDEQQDVRTSRGRELTDDDTVQKVKAELSRRNRIKNRHDFERGLVLTGQMREIIDDLLSTLAQGKPALFVGETATAKTALAEFIARVYFGVEPEKIDASGDINPYQVMGKPVLSTKDGVTVSDFAPGPMLRAMEEGRPVIIDEGDASPAEFLKRLNRILQLRPGDKFIAQEDSGREITVKQGFFIIVTANERSKRYRGLEELSTEFKNRFGANIVRLQYPDHDVPYGEAPRENATIAFAALSDRAGNLAPGIDMGELERFISACHVVQQVFSGNHGEGFQQFASTDQIRDEEPGLATTVLAPRTMVALLEKVRDSQGRKTIDDVLKQFVRGIKEPKDRAVMTTILRGYDFLMTPQQPASGTGVPIPGR